MAKRLPPDEVQMILSSGKFDDLLGVIENEHLECKGAPYQLDQRMMTVDSEAFITVQVMIAEDGDSGAIALNDFENLLERRNLFRIFDFAAFAGGAPHVVVIGVWLVARLLHGNATAYLLPRNTTALSVAEETVKIRERRTFLRAQSARVCPGTARVRIEDSSV